MTSHNPDFFGIVAKGQKKENFFKVREKLNFKSTCLFFSQYLYCFLIFKILLCILCRIGWILFMKLNGKSMLAFQEHQFVLHCTWVAESINKWVEGIAVRGRLSPSAGQMCEIVNAVGLGNFAFFVRKKSGKSQNFRNLWLWHPWLEGWRWGADWVFHPALRGPVG